MTRLLAALALVAATAVAPAPHAGPPTPPRVVRSPATGAALARRVRRELRKRFPDAARYVRVAAASGVVTIRGSLYPETQQAMIAAAQGIEGVKSVKWVQK